MDRGLSSSPMPAIITASKAGLIHAETYKIVSADCDFMYGFCILQDLTRNSSPSICCIQEICMKVLAQMMEVA